MAIKRLSEKKLLNKKVGLIGTLTGEVVEVNINETKAGKDFLKESSNRNKSASVSQGIRPPRSTAPNTVPQAIL